MEDTELVENFIRQEVVGDMVRILVCDITWEGPYDPKSEWVAAAQIPREHSPDTLDATIARLLRNRRFFGVCKECGGRQPRGWMLSDDMCQDCAAKQGVVF